MINPIKEIQIYKKAIETFGAAVQKVVAMEELSELIIALECLRFKEESNYTEEIADVSIMINQLKMMYKIPLSLKGNTKVKKDTLIHDCILSLSHLIQAISKDTRKKDVDIKSFILDTEAYIDTFFKMKNHEEIEKFKDEKLERLKGIVY